MRYFDTSVLSPFVLPVATSERITRFFDDLPTDALAVRHWTRVEFASLLTRKVRMGSPEAAAAREAGSKFETIIEESFVVPLPNHDDFDLARELLSHFETGLRAGDALHLAIASNCGADLQPGQGDDRGWKVAACAGNRRGSPAGLQRWRAGSSPRRRVSCVRFCQCRTKTLR